MSLILDGSLGVTVDAGTAALPAVVSATGTADTGLWFPAADTVAASTAGTERMRIDSSGNVMMGLTNGSTHGKFSAKGGQSGTATSSAAFITPGTAQTEVADLALYSTFTGTGDNGTRRTADILAGMTANWGSEYLTFNVGYGGAPNDTKVVTLEKMRIDSSGNVLVGTTTTPAQNVKGIYLSIAGQQSYQKLSHGTLTTAAEYFYFYNGNGQVGSISSNGSTTSYTTSSDYRLKNTIAPMTGALAKISLLKPVTYKWNADGSDGQGFIAHELQEVVEGCVTGEKDATREEEYEVTPAVPAVVDAEGVETTPAVQAVKGTRTVPSYQGVDTSFLVATLTAAIQELKAIIDTQAAQITALNAKVGI